MSNDDNFRFMQYKNEYIKTQREIEEKRDEIVKIRDYYQKNMNVISKEESDALVKRSKELTNDIKNILDRFKTKNIDDRINYLENRLKNSNGQLSMGELSEIHNELSELVDSKYKLESYMNSTRACW